MTLADFTVELDVYSGPYEWLLALILKEELEIFEVPLRELVGVYLGARDPRSANTLERDTDFVGSAAALVLLKSRTLSPLLLDEPEDPDAEAPASPEELAERLSRYLMIRRGAQELSECLAANAGHYPSAHPAPPRPGRLRLSGERLAEAARRTFSRLVDPPVHHLGPITVTIQELSALIRSSLARGGPVSYEELTRKMDRLQRAVAFAAALSLAQEGGVRLSQSEPLGPLTLESYPPCPRDAHAGA
jgi:segregation and condensation protein A